MIVYFILPIAPKIGHFNILLALAQNLLKQTFIGCESVLGQVMI